MTLEELAGHIDATLLKAGAAVKDIENMIMDAIKYPFASVCIPPCHVALASSLVKGGALRVGTVVGFPLGYQTFKTKLIEAREAVESGAKEIDMVMNISAFKSRDISSVEEEIAGIVSNLPGIVVKVIIETCYLSEIEKATACELAIKGGAGFVKTSTGFGPGGATVEDVRFLRDSARGRIKVKASGGLKTLDEALRMIESGATRIGTSSAVPILKEFLMRSSAPDK